MNANNSNTKDQLLEELRIRGKRVAELEKLEVERKQVEKALREGEEKYRSLFELSPIGITILDMKGVITSCNSAVHKEGGYSKDELVGRHFSKIAPLRAMDIPKYVKIFRSIIKGKVPEPFEVKYQRKDGTIGWTEIHVSLLEIDGRKQGVQVLQRDLTKRKQAEDALRQSEEKYRQLVSTSTDAIMLVDAETKRLIEVNKASEELYEYSQEEFRNMTVRDISAEPEKSEAAVKDIIRGRLKRIPVRYHKKKDGTKFPLEISTSKFEMGDRTVLCGVARDVSERMLSEARLSHAQRIAKIGSWEWDLAKGTMVWSGEMYHILGMDPVSYRPMAEDFKRFVHEDDLAVLDPERMQRVFAQGTYTVEYRVIHQTTGEVKNVQVCGWVTKNDSGEPVFVTGTLQDVTQREQAEEELRKHRDHLEELVKNRTAELTDSNVQLKKEIRERKRAQEKLQASLREKEVLLQEVHHRVKNNMQIISSLLKLQSRYVKDERYLELLKESEKRIDSMALIHEKLYQSEDLGSIDFSAYIGSLAHDLFQFYSVDPEKIVLKLDVDDIVLGVDTAIPCGLIINELVSNCLKYAFPDGMVGAIEVALHMIDENEIELVVSDNGVGMPEGMELGNIESLGLYLVTNLAERQLGGTIELDGVERTEFQIRFKELQAKRGV